MTTIYIGGDHAGFKLKGKIVKYLEKLGYKVKDFGPHKLDPDDDYPDFVLPTARATAKKKTSRGIALGASGIGECIAANKIRGVRAALVYDIYTAKMSREHNDSNVLCLGAVTLPKNFTLVKRIIKTWLETPFSKNPRYKRRIKQVRKRT